MDILSILGILVTPVRLTVMVIPDDSQYILSLVIVIQFHKKKMTVFVQAQSNIGHSPTLVLPNKKLHGKPARRPLVTFCDSQKRMACQNKTYRDRGANLKSGVNHRNGPICSRK